jgi:adenine/guanine phosphoribosyltransferase-like PRPP-binding protein
MENWDLFYPIKIAKRYNNKKRSYLLVNMIQGKHIPVRPDMALNMYEVLGKKIKKKYPDAKLIIGFAETATALGFGTASAMGNDCTYLTTTRESSIANSDCILFYEEHSHAAEQKMYIRGFDLLLKRTKEVVFIDDEISTGKTLFNIINALKVRFNELENHKIIVGSILNRVTTERENDFKKHNIYFESIFRFSSNDNSLLQNGKELCAPSDEYYDKPGFLPKVSLMDFKNSRIQVNVRDYLNNCKQLGKIILNQLDFQGVAKFLVLGTEECMYPSIYIAKMIEKEYGIETYCHSTTRSPICIGNDSDYPFINGYMLHSFYDDNRITYIYNLSRYDAALIISDATEPSEQALKSFDSLLDSFKISKRFYVFGR